MTRRPIVAIDGPAGAGKSTVARGVADALGFLLVDTGALYRAVALAAEREGVDWTDAAAVTDVAEGLVASKALGLERDDAAGMRVVLRGEDVSLAIRTPNMGMGASTVSAFPGVRAALLAMQRQAGELGGVVLEGRDIGTVVFPDAEVKVFLTARPEVRARRRHEELVARGAATGTFEQTLQEVVLRDRQDSQRPVAPLRRAPDATEVDTSDLDIDAAVATIVARVLRA